VGISEAISKTIREAISEVIREAIRGDQRGDQMLFEGQEEAMTCASFQSGPKRMFMRLIARQSGRNFSKAPSCDPRRRAKRRSARSAWLTSLRKS
jgi:hypothetical protein